MTRAEESAATDADELSGGSAVERRLRELGHELPPLRAPVGDYVGLVQVERLVFVSGHGPFAGEEMKFRGKLGKDLSIEEGQKAAEQAILSALSRLRAELGDLDRIVRVVKVFGMVNCTPDFEDQPRVMDGASNLLTAVFGEAGRHARSAVGFVALPFGIPIEIEMIVEVS